MNRRFLSIAALLSVSSAAWGLVSPIDPTLPYRYGTMSYPMHREAAEDMEDWCWDYDVFAGGYHRQANKAFSANHGSGDNNETPMARLLFGKDKFKLGESFPDGKVGADVLNNTRNPFIGSTTLAPNYDFEENGAMFRASVNTSWGCWKMGVRGSIPFRSLDVKEVCSGDVNGVKLEGETKKDDLYVERSEIKKFPARSIVVGVEDGNPVLNEDPQQNANQVFAARLDLLSAMKSFAFGTNGLQDADPLVKYQDSDKGEVITIASINVGQAPQNTNNPGANNNQPAVAVINRNDGSLPIDQRWGEPNTEINGSVAGDGSGLSNNQRGRFNSNTNYSQLSNDVAEQSDLWVVPTIAVNDTGSSHGAGSITQGAQQIRSAITSALPLVDDSIEDFINRADLDFCDGRTQGAGDLDFELYLGYDWTDCADIWSELSFGIRVPTGEEQENCRNVLKQPAGLNDHVGIRIGSEHGWDLYDWIKLNIGLRYTFVLDDNEPVAAPFRGATIYGIGPCIQAETEWGYLEGFFNATMPVNDCCGFDIGYQVYHQPSLDCDDVRLCQSTATDLADRQDQPLDASILTCNTERTSHKVRAAFHMAYENCQFNMGFAHSFAGQNIVRDTDWYAGISVDF